MTVNHRTFVITIYIRSNNTSDRSVKIKYSFQDLHVNHPDSHGGVCGKLHEDKRSSLKPHGSFFLRTCEQEIIVLYEINC